MIETERLLLGAWRETDKSDFAALANTAAMTANLGGVTTRAAFDDLVYAQMAQQAAHGHRLWAVESRATDALLGICGVRRGGHAETPVPDELEIGWRSAQNAWGQSYARAAAAASLTWA